MPDAGSDASAGSADPATSMLYTDRDAVIIGSAPVEVYAFLRDSNNVPIVGADVQLAVTSGSITTPGPTDIAGQVRATWTNTVPGVYGVSLSVDGVTLATHTVAFTAGAPVAIAFEPGPGDVLAGQPFSPAITIVTVDAYGNRAAGGVGWIDLSLEPNPYSAQLETPGLNMTGGTATVDGLRVVTPGTGYQIRAHMETYGDIVSAPFDVAMGDADMARSTIVAAPTSLQADGAETATISLHLANAFGIVIPGAPVSLSATGSNNIMSATSGTTSSTGDFSATIASTTAEAKTVTALVGGLTLTTNVHFYGPACTPQLPGAPARVVLWGGMKLVVGDMTGDGHADAVVLDGTAQLWLYAGRGDGTFDAPLSLPSLANIQYMTAADINGDGRLDLLMTVSSGALVAIELGTGGGHFATATYADLATYEIESATRFTVGDFNGDGARDLAVGTDHGKVVIEIGAGDGTFTTGAIMTSLAPYDIGAADVNSDGHTDLVLDGVNGVTTLLGNGDGTFAAPVTLAGQATGNLVIADFNGDGHADCAVATPGWTLQSYLGTGTGAFTQGGTPIPTAQYNSSTSGPALVAARDVDGDGHPDLVLGEGPSATILHGQGNGAFSVAEVYAADARGIGMADADEDGISDVIALGTSILAALPGRGDGSFIAPKTHAEPDDRGGLFRTAADFDGNGQRDLVIQTALGIRALLARPASTLTDAAMLAETDEAYDLRAGDVTGDGLPDLIGAFPASTGVTIRVANGLGDGSFASFTTFALASLDVRDLQLADLDRDGKQDLVMVSHTNDTIWIARSVGDGTFEAPQEILGARDWAAIGDFDGDGIVDLLSSDGFNATYVRYGDGAGGFGLPAAGLSPPLGVAPLITDIDGDGRSDVVATAGGSIIVWRGLASRTFGAALVTSSPDVDLPSTIDSTLVDITGDGVLDLVGHAAASVVVVPGYGDGYFHKHGTAYPVADGGTIPRRAAMVVTDVDRDGRADVVFWKGMGVGIAFNRGCVP